MKQQIRRILSRGRVLPLAFNLYRSVREWSPALAASNARLRRAARATIPVPPSGLMFSVAGSRDVRWFLESGHAAAATIQRVAAAMGFPLQEQSAVLDFGCGCGRVLRHLARVPRTVLHGCDYNPDGIGWLAEHLPLASARVNNLEPPLSYDSGSFDVVYSLSVFTHFPEPLQHAWMREMHRILRPGGLLLFSTMGEAFIGRLTPNEQAAFGRGELIVRDGEYAGGNVCAAYHPESHVRSGLSAGFDVKAFYPAGGHGLPGQDLHAFQRNSAAATPATHSE